MTPKRRILIISMKAGAGHIRAAQAIESALRNRHPGNEVRHLEALEFAAPAFRRAFNAFYFSMIRWTPSLWRMIYEGTEHAAERSVPHRFGEMLNQWGFRRLRQEIESFAPDSIICTHFTPAQIAATMKREKCLDADLSVVLTDFAPHGMWLHDGIDQYFAPSDDAARELKNRRPNASVSATGIPISGAFARTGDGRAAARRALGLAADVPVVLLSCGGGGTGSLEQIARLLSDELPAAQILAVSGHNARALAAVRELVAGGRGNIVSLGFVANMHELMAASDVAVTKPGGLTSSECLAMGLPMVLVDPIPGQEERNAAFLQACGAGCLARNAGEIAIEVQRILEEPQIPRRMRRAALRASKPNAAIDVADMVAGSRAAEPVMVAQSEILAGRV